jgi:hypothetical protein
MEPNMNSTSKTELIPIVLLDKVYKNSMVFTASFRHLFAAGENKPILSLQKSRVFAHLGHSTVASPGNGFVGQKKSA